MTEIVKPHSKEKARFEALKAMSIGDVIVIDRDEQQKYSESAGVFHKTTDRVYRTSRRNQPNGKAIVWREA